MDIPAGGSSPGDTDRLTRLLRWRWLAAVALLLAAGLVLAFLNIATDFPSQVTCEWWYVAPTLGEEFYHPATGKLNVAALPGGQRCFALSFT